MLCSGLLSLTTSMYLISALLMFHLFCFACTHHRVLFQPLWPVHTRHVSRYPFAPVLEQSSPSGRLKTRINVAPASYPIPQLACHESAVYYQIIPNPICSSTYTDVYRFLANKVQWEFIGFSASSMGFQISKSQRGVSCSDPKGHVKSVPARCRSLPHLGWPFAANQRAIAGKGTHTRHSQRHRPIQTSNTHIHVMPLYAIDLGSRYRILLTPSLTVSGTPKNPSLPCPSSTSSCWILLYAGTIHIVAILLLPGFVVTFPLLYRLNFRNFSIEKHGCDGGNCTAIFSAIGIRVRACVSYLSSTKIPYLSTFSAPASADGTPFKRFK